MHVVMRQTAAVRARQPVRDRGSVVVGAAEVCRPTRRGAEVAADAEDQGMIMRIGRVLSGLAALELMPLRRRSCLRCRRCG